MKQAFTLIELLVVVLIIGILSAIALPQYTKAVEKARSAEAVQNVSTLQRAVDIYLLENGYPSSTQSFLGGGSSANGKDLLTLDITQGMNCDTIAAQCYSKYFTYRSSCSSTRCYIEACYQDPNGPECLYDLGLTREKSTDVWTKECNYSAAYEYLCKGLESLGFTRNAC